MMRRLFVVALIVAIALPAVTSAGPARRLTMIAPRFVETLAIAELATKVAAEAGYQLDAVWLPFDATRTKLILDFRGGSKEWDIIYIDSAWLPEFAKLGLATPIDNLAVDLTALKTDDFVASHMERQRFDRKTWALPILAAYHTLAYRKDLFACDVEQAAFRRRHAYDLAPPRTHKEFRDVAEFFTRKAGESLCGRPLAQPFFGTVHSNRRGGFLWHDFINYLVAFGADVIFDPRTMRPTWNSPQTLAAVKFYNDLARFQPPGHINMTSGEATSVFASGHAAMQIEFLNTMVSIAEDASRSAIAGDVGYALPPSHEGTSGRPHAYLDNTNGMGVYARSENAKVAFQVLTQVLSTDGQATMALNNLGYLPTRRSAWRDGRFIRKYPQIVTYIDLVQRQKPFIFGHPQIPEYPEVRDIASDSVYDVVSGTKTPEQALTEAQRKIEEVFRRVGYLR